MDTTLKRLRQICDRYRDCAPDYYLEPIPEPKMANARRVLRVPDDETIVALIDLTLLGSAKNSLVVTEKGLYWKNVTEGHLSWAKLKQQMFSQSGSFITFADKNSICLVGSTKLAEANNRSVFNLIRDLQDYSDDIQNGSQSVGVSAGIVGGLVVCEFCGKGVKPEVTYCKYCGIKMRG